MLRAAIREPFTVWNIIWFHSDADPRKILPGSGRPFRAPGQGTVAGLRARRRARRRGHPGLEQVEPRARDRGFRAGQCARGGGCGSPRPGVEASLPRGRGPHQPGNRGPVHRAQRFLHTRRGFGDRTARSGGGPRGVCGPACGTGGPAEHPGHRGAFRDDCRQHRRDCRQVSLRGPGGRTHLPAHRKPQRSGLVHHGNLDGRDRRAADAAAIAGHPGGGRR